MLSVKACTPKTMTVMQVANALQVSRSTAYDLVNSEEFPKIKIGKRILIPRDAFQAWIEKNTIISFSVNT